MKVIIHCGFPKTGTTSLQKWFALNEVKLTELGILYPTSLRDEEGLAHHLMNSFAEEGFEELADRIAELVEEVSKQGSLIRLNKIVFSAEGLSSILGREDDSGSAFFVKLANYLNLNGHTTKYLFTLRPIRSYIRSITIQNILYDGLCELPSSFAAHTLLTLSRAYSSLSSLVKTGTVTLFEYTSNVNQEIISHITERSFTSLSTTTNISLEHASPRLDIILLFIWLNRMAQQVPPDLHSYLRFSPSARLLLNELYEQVSMNAISYESFACSWEPTPELVDSCLRYLYSSWIHSLSYEARKDPDADSEASEFLRKHQGKDIHCLIHSSLIELDYMHFIASKPELSPYFLRKFEELTQQGSSEYGQDFTSGLTDLRLKTQCCQ